MALQREARLHRGHASSRPGREGVYAADLFDKVKCGMDGKITKVYVPTEIGVEYTVEMGSPDPRWSSLH